LGVLSGILVFLAIRFLFPFISYQKPLRTGVAGRYRADSLPFTIESKISEGLTKINQKGEVEPDLAKSWETPDKGKTWVFHLDENKYWQDETRFTSQDLRFDFSDVSVDKPDDTTIIFTLDNPFTPFPSVVSKPVFKKGLLGTGEWKVSNVTVTSGYVAELTIVKIDGQSEIFKFYPTEENAKLAFKLGKVDRLINIFDNNPFDEWETVKVSQQPNPNRVVTLFFNTQDELMGDKSFRQALMYALDKETLGGIRAISPISPDSWVYNTQVKKYSYDEKRAQDLLDEYPEEFRSSLSVNLVATPVLLDVAEKIKAYWEKIGVKTVIQVVSGVPEEYQAFIAIFDIPKDPDQYALWHSTQTATNVSKYTNPRIDKLLEDGRTELLREERKKIYFDFQRFLLEDLPAGFLYHPEAYTINRK